MTFPIIIVSFISWCSSTWASISPLIPGIVAVGGWTFGGHFVSFAGSWLSARWYSKNCIGEGLPGLYQSYWKMGSPMCATLLISHVSLLAIAIASVVCTLMLFLWFWYSTFKRILWPIKNEIEREFHTNPSPKKNKKNTDVVIDLVDEVDEVDEVDDVDEVDEVKL